MYYINRYNNLNEVVIIIKGTRIAMISATGAQAFFMINFLSSLTGLRHALYAIEYLDVHQLWCYVGFVISSYLLFCMPLVAIALLFSESKKIQKIGAWVGIFSIIPWIIFLTIISPFLFWGFDIFIILGWWIGVISCVVMFVAAILTLTKLPSKGKTIKLKTNLNLINA